MHNFLRYFLKISGELRDTKKKKGKRKKGKKEINIKGTITY